MAYERGRRAGGHIWSYHRFGLPYMGISYDRIAVYGHIAEQVGLPSQNNARKPSYSPVQSPSLALVTWVK